MFSPIVTSSVRPLLQGGDVPERGVQGVKPVAFAVVVAGGVVGQTVPEPDRPLGDGRHPGGGVAPGDAQAVSDGKAPFVADGDGRPASRLADDNSIRGGGVQECAGPGGSPLFLHGPHHPHAHPRLGADARGRQDEGRQRPLGIHRPAPVEAPVLQTDGDKPLHRVHVAQEHQFPRPLAESANDVAYPVPPDLKPHLAHPPG
jgi:hypothetical protein